MLQRTLLVILISLPAASCAGSTPAPAGAPAVRVHRYSESVSYEEPVLSGAKVRDGQGELLADQVTVTVMREEEVERERMDLLVGGTVVDELEFYRVTRDAEAVRWLESRRKGPNRGVRAGIFLIGLGLAATVASVPLGLGKGRLGGILSLSLGGTVASYGSLLAIWGQSGLKSERRRVSLPESRARAATHRWKSSQP